jgi:hypothetical protein
MRSALSYTNTLSWIFIVLVHLDNSPWIDMSPHSDTLSWFRANQSLLFSLMLRAYRRSNRHPFYSLVWTDRSSKPRSTVPVASTLSITPSIQLLDIKIGTLYYKHFIRTNCSKLIGDYKNNTFNLPSSRLNDFTDNKVVTQ